MAPIIEVISKPWINIRCLLRVRLPFIPIEDINMENIFIIKIIAVFLTE